MADKNNRSVSAGLFSEDEGSQAGSDNNSALDQPHALLSTQQEQDDQEELNHPADADVYHQQEAQNQNQNYPPQQQSGYPQQQQDLQSPTPPLSEENSFQNTSQQQTPQQRHPRQNQQQQNQSTPYQQQQQYQQQPRGNNNNRQNNQTDEEISVEDVDDEDSDRRDSDDNEDEDRDSADDRNEDDDEEDDISADEETNKNITTSVLGKRVATQNENPNNTQTSSNQPQQTATNNQTAATINNQQTTNQSGPQEFDRYLLELEAQTRTGVGSTIGSGANQLSEDKLTASFKKFNQSRRQIVYRQLKNSAEEDRFNAHMEAFGHKQVCPKTEQFIMGLPGCSIKMTLPVRQAITSAAKIHAGQLVELAKQVQIEELRDRILDTMVKEQQQEQEKLFLRQKQNQQEDATDGLVVQDSSQENETNQNQIQQQHSLMNVGHLLNKRAMKALQKEIDGGNSLRPCSPRHLREARRRMIQGGSFIHDKPKAMFLRK